MSELRRTKRTYRPEGEATDKALLRAHAEVRTHDRRASDALFATLYQRHEPPLRNLVCQLVKRVQGRNFDHALVDDILQRTFLNLLEHLQDIVEKHPEQEDLHGLLVTIAKRITNDIFNKTSEQLLAAPIHLEAPAQHRPEQQVLQKEAHTEQRAQQELLRRTIAAIPDPLVRKAVFLIVIREMSYPKVNAVLKTNSHTTKQMMRMGELWVREALEVKKVIEKNSRPRVELLEHIRSEYPHRFYAAIHQVLGDRQREVLIDTYEHHKSPQEIAQQTGLAAHTTYDTLKNARDILQSILQLKPTYRSGMLEQLDRVKEQELDIFEAALERIRSVEQRRSIELYELSGHSYQRIAEEMQLQEAQVRDLLYKGRQQVLLLLQGKELRQYERPLKEIRAAFESDPSRMYVLIEQHLSAMQRVAITHLLEGKDRFAIAETMSLSKKQVDQVVQDAVTKLQKVLKKE